MLNITGAWNRSYIRAGILALLAPRSSLDFAGFSPSRLADFSDKRSILADERSLSDQR